MTDPFDLDIEAALRALGAAEPEPGLEDRVLRRVVQAQKKSASEPGRSWHGVASALAVACLMLALLWLERRPEPARPTEAAAVSHTSSRGRSKNAAETPVPSPRLLASAERKVDAVVPARPVNATISSPALALFQPAPSRGLADLPSMLATPEATTRQEHLLDQAAHGPGPVALALLDPDYQAQLAQQSAAEFQQFFPPQTPQEIYLATHIQN